MASLYDDELQSEITADTIRITRILSSGIHMYDIPTTRSMDFTKIFPGPFDNATTADVLSVATSHREEAMDSLTYSNASPDPRNVVNSLRTYFPDVWCLTESMESMRRAVRFFLFCFLLHLLFVVVVCCSCCSCCCCFSLHSFPIFHS